MPGRWPVGVLMAILGVGLPGYAALAGPQAPAAIRSAYPDLPTFLGHVRRALRDDWQRMAGYSYRQKVIRYTQDEGERSIRSERVYLARPGGVGEDMRRILVSEDGEPVPRDELLAQERELRRPASRKEREQAAERRREETEALDEVFEICVARFVGRERVAGHPTLVLEFEPRPGAEPRTRIGRILGHSTGRVWITEDTHQVVRFEARTIDTVLFGWGLLARLHPGTSLRVERRLVDGSVWMPASYQAAGGARLLLLKTARFDIRSEFDDYRKSDPDGPWIWEHLADGPAGSARRP